MTVSKPPSPAWADGGDLVIAAMGLVMGVVLVVAGWIEAVEYRARSGDGTAMWLPASATAVALLAALALVTVVLDRGRRRAVLMIAGALVIVPLVTYVVLHRMVLENPGL